MVMPAATFAIARWRNVSAAAALMYSLAYIQHIAIGDIAIGGTNVLYPFGNMLVGSGVGYGTLVHQTLEFLLLAGAAAIIISKSFRIESKNSLALFRFSMTDKVGYALLIAALVISFTYLLYGIKVLPRLFIQTDLELALFVMLHLSAIALVSFFMLVAKQYARSQTVVNVDRP
jgi:hypothetical protein